MLGSLGSERGLSALVRKRKRMICSYSCWKGRYKADGGKLFCQRQMTEQEATATSCSLGGSDWAWAGEKKHSPGGWCCAGTDPQRGEGSPSS